jgi:hypothetical protein
MLAVPSLNNATPAEQLCRWLDGVRFFIPKSIREPFLGDLRMVTEEHSGIAINFAVISQVVILIVEWLWSKIVSRR